MRLNKNLKLCPIFVDHYKAFNNPLPNPLLFKGEGTPRIQLIT